MYSEHGRTSKMEILRKLVGGIPLLSSILDVPLGFDYISAGSVFYLQKLHSLYQKVIEMMANYDLGILVKSLTVKMLFTYINQYNRSLSIRPSSAKSNGFLYTLPLLMPKSAKLAQNISLTFP